MLDVAIKTENDGVSMYIKLLTGLTSESALDIL